MRLSVPASNSRSVRISSSAPNSESLSLSSPAVSFSPMGVSALRSMSPVSMPISVYIVVIPVTASPIITHQLIGALPRWRGSSDAWTLIVPSLGTSKIS